VIRETIALQLIRVFFASFCSQKEVLPCLPYLTYPAR
jgi:hypothetical protein